LLNKIIYNFLKFIYHWSTYLTSWSWFKLYGDRRKGYGYKKTKPKGGILRMDQTRINYYKSLISYDKRDNLVEQIIKEKMNNGKRKR